MSKKNKKDEKLLAQSYDIEVLEDKIKVLEEINRDTREKLWEVIKENDRLTLTYEPYRPPGDEYEGLGFYELIEENDNLTQNIVDKMEVISELDEEIANLTSRNNRLTRELIDIRTAVAEMKVAKEKKYPKCGVVSFDFWPPSDWFRLSRHRWNPGKAAQVCIGPIRIDWFEG